VHGGEGRGRVRKAGSALKRAGRRGGGRGGGGRAASALQKGGTLKRGGKERRRGRGWRRARFENQRRGARLLAERLERGRHAAQVGEVRAHFQICRKHAESKERAFSHGRENVHFQFEFGLTLQIISSINKIIISIDFLLKLTWIFFLMRMVKSTLHFQVVCGLTALTPQIIIFVL